MNFNFGELIRLSDLILKSETILDMIIPTALSLTDEDEKSLRVAINKP